MEPTLTDVKEYKYFADGEWREAADGNVFDVHEPYTGKLFACVAAGSWGRTGPRSLDDFSDVIWINSHSGQRKYPF
jgi:hypothetical protein